MRWPARRTGDRGSGPITALMVMAILALIFTIGITALFAAAGDERSSAMHAADAAALAGARGVLDDAPAALSPGFTTPAEIPMLLGGGVCVQTGRVDAFRLAAANNATLTSYCYNVFTDTVRVTVRMNESNVGDGVATAAAEAVTSFQPASCVLDSEFTPPPDDPPDDEPPPPEDEPPPPNPDPIDTTIDCGFGGLAVIFRFPEERFYFVDLARALDDRDPRLTR
jgi:hypothetical protein